MMLTWLWLSSLVGAPLVVVLHSSLARNERSARSVAIACAAVATALGALVPFVPALRALAVPWPAEDSALLGATMLRVTSLSLPLVALPSGLWLMTLVATPAARLDVAGLRRTAIAAAAGTLAFITESPALLACCWVTSSALLVRGLATTAESRRAGRIVAAYHVVSSLLFVGGVAWTAAVGPDASGGLWLIIAAVLIRKGIFPAHSWIPEALDRGRIGPTVLFSAPQLGTFIAAILVVPHATVGMLRAVAVLSLITALYGAALALFQSDARRALGYVFVSQSALVLAGLDCGAADALTGALVLWLSSAIAFTGMARTVLALEARRGRLRLTRYHGGLERMPLLATSFLIFGLACTGFPGTLGFVGQELLIDGAVRAFPAVGFLTVATSALTGLAVLRMYFSLFCGARAGSGSLDLLPRETLAFGAAAVLLVGTGVVPGTIVSSRQHASVAILSARNARSVSSEPAGAPSGTPGPGRTRQAGERSTVP